MPSSYRLMQVVYRVCVGVEKSEKRGSVCVAVVAKSRLLLVLLLLLLSAVVGCVVVVGAVGLERREELSE